jgi:hypothetical protein
MMLLSLLLALAIPGGEVDAPMTVNQQVVSRQEFSWYMEQERTGVFEYFKTTCNLEDGKDFWTRECAGITPRALLQKRTTDRVTREKVEQILFQELGLIQDIRYSSFLENLEKLNLSREESAKGGQVLYGPVRYTQLQFYGHWKASLQLEAKKKLAEGRPTASDQELRAFYNRVKDSFQTPATTTLGVISIQPSRESDESGSLIGAILAAAEDSRTVQEILQRFGDRKGVRISSRRYEALDSDRISELFSADGDAAKIFALAPSQCLSMTGSVGTAEVIRCVSKTPAAYPPFEAVRERVRARYLDAWYERLVAERVSNAVIERDSKMIDALLPP